MSALLTSISSVVEIIFVIALGYFLRNGGKFQDSFALMLDLRTDFSLPCKLIAEEHFLYDSIFTRI
ncbi:hypothetical protein [Weissella confusa]|uniref:hypothetical protein n=1 Tax=Weissella confusa TaxID=1583 RepID=UPI00355C8890